MTDTTFQQRLLQEQEELNTRLVKIRLFISNNEKFEKVSPIQQQLLVLQEVSMSSYADILARRVADLRKNGAL